MVETSDTLYDRYMRDIASFPRITPEREIQLSTTILRSRKARQVESAVHELVQSNLLLVIHCLKEFSKYLESPGVRITTMDLISEGNIGLIKAAHNFDAGGCSLPGTNRSDAHIRFSTYACKSIKNAMRRAIKLSRFIHIPEHHFSYWSRMKALRDEHGERLTDDLLERNLGVGPAKLWMLKQSEESGTALLDDLGTAGGEASRWSETMEDPAASCPSDNVEGRDMREYLFAEMEVLPERTQRMLQMMYLDGTAETFSDLARVFGVSKERCRQVCSHGLAVLRQRLQAKRRKVMGSEAGRTVPETQKAAAQPTTAGLKKAVSKNRGLHVTNPAHRSAIRLRRRCGDVRSLQVSAA